MFPLRLRSLLRQASLRVHSRSITLLPALSRMSRLSHVSPLSLPEWKFPDASPPLTLSPPRQLSLRPLPFSCSLSRSPPRNLKRTSGLMLQGQSNLGSDRTKRLKADAYTCEDMRVVPVPENHRSSSSLDNEIGPQNCLAPSTTSLRYPKSVRELMDNLVIECREDFSFLGELMMRDNGSEATKVYRLLNAVTQITDGKLQLESFVGPLVGLFQLDNVDILVRSVRILHVFLKKFFGSGTDSVSIEGAASCSRLQTSLLGTGPARVNWVSLHGFLRAVSSKLAANEDVFASMNLILIHTKALDELEVQKL